MIARCIEEKEFKDTKDYKSTLGLVLMLIGIMIVAGAFVGAMVGSFCMEANELFFMSKVSPSTVAMALMTVCGVLFVFLCITSEIKVSSLGIVLIITAPFAASFMLSAMGAYSKDATMSWLDMHTQDYFKDPVIALLVLIAFAEMIFILDKSKPSPKDNTAHFTILHKVEAYVEALYLAAAVWVLNVLYTEGWLLPLVGVPAGLWVYIKVNELKYRNKGGKT